MSEGNLYICCWKKYSDRFRVWLKSNPEIQAEALSFNEASQNIVEQISCHLGDGEPLLDFTPPPPDRYLVLLFNHSSEISIGFDSIFKRAICTYCGCTHGQRTNTQLQVMALPPKADITEVTIGKRIIPLYSEKFLNALTCSERKSLKFTEVISKRKSAQKFYEITARPDVLTVFAKAISFKGWQCPKCSLKRWGHYRVNDPIHDYIASEDVSDSMRTFTVENGTMQKLTMTPERYEKIKMNQATRGIVADPLGVLNDGQYIRAPKLPLLKN